MEFTGLILKNRNRKMIDRNRFILYYGRSDEEVQGCREYVKKWWPKETDARLEIANQVCENKFIFNLPWDIPWMKNSRRKSQNDFSRRF